MYPSYDFFHFTYWYSLTAITIHFGRWMRYILPHSIDVAVHMYKQGMQTALTSCLYFADAKLHLIANVQALLRVLSLFCRVLLVDNLWHSWTMLTTSWNHEQNIPVCVWLPLSTGTTSSQESFGSGRTPSPMDAQMAAAAPNYDPQPTLSPTAAFGPRTTNAFFGDLQQPQGDPTGTTCSSMTNGHFCFLYMLPLNFRDLSILLVLCDFSLLHIATVQRVSKLDLLFLFCLFVSCCSVSRNSLRERKPSDHRNSYRNSGSFDENDIPSPLLEQLVGLVWSVFTGVQQLHFKT